MVLTVGDLRGEIISLFFLAVTPIAFELLSGSLAVILPEKLARDFRETSIHTSRLPFLVGCLVDLFCEYERIRNFEFRVIF